MSSLMKAVTATGDTIPVKGGDGGSIGRAMGPIREVAQPIDITRQRETVLVFGQPSAQGITFGHPITFEFRRESISSRVNP